jgi:hypothetical protein
MRRMAEYTIGITAQRPIPAFADTDLLHWLEYRRRPKNRSPRGEVILAADSFAEPDVGRFAVELLGALGGGVWR